MVYCWPEERISVVVRFNRVSSEAVAADVIGPGWKSADPSIWDQGILRPIDPESESENELCNDAYKAVRVGFELQGVPRALASEECFDRTAAEPTKLLEKDQELSEERPPQPGFVIPTVNSTCSLAMGGSVS